MTPFHAPHRNVVASAGSMSRGLVGGERGAQVLLHGADEALDAVGDRALDIGKVFGSRGFEHA